MRCSRARRLFSAHLDDELDPRRRASLESHLAGCASCSAELARLKAPWDVPAEAEPGPRLPSDLWPRILAAMDEAERLPWHRRYRTPLMQAACITACVVLGLAAGARMSWMHPAVEADSTDGVIGERILVAEAFDTAAFGLRAEEEGLLRCVPK